MIIYNRMQIRWQKWKNWFHTNLKREGRRVDQMREHLDKLNSSQLNYYEQSLTDQMDAAELYTRATALDSRIKQSRQEKNILALTEGLIETEAMIEQMGRFFLHQTRPDDTKRAGSKPNASIVLTDDELAFIDRQYGGSKSAAIHAGLKQLRERAEPTVEKLAEKLTNKSCKNP